MIPEDSLKVTEDVTTGSARPGLQCCWLTVSHWVNLAKGQSARESWSHQQAELSEPHSITCVGPLAQGLASSRPSPEVSSFPSEPEASRTRQCPQESADSESPGLIGMMSHRLGAGGSLLSNLVECELRLPPLVAPTLLKACPSNDLTAQGSDDFSCLALE